MYHLIKLALFIALIALAALAAFIRAAPSDPARWHIALHPRPAEIAAPSRALVTLRNGAYVDLQDSPNLLARLDAIAMATPRTIRLAGSAAEGRITWVTRSLMWGFPDYTTAEMGRDGLTIFARQRFGGNDHGVNAARLAAWVSALQM